MPHLLTLEPASGETRVTLHTAGSLVATHIVPAGTLESLSTRADALLSRSGDQYPTRYDLLAFGRELADCLLGPATLPALLALRGRLWIVSADADLLNLPLELIPRDPASFLIEGGHLLLRRTAEPAGTTAAAETVTRPGPLRVLFMACSPQDENRLAFEKEEEAMVKLFLRAGKIAHLEIAESGTFEELAQKVASYRPHIVHLSGHAALEEGTGYFCFEDERGNLDLRSATEITDRVFAHSGVGMVFVSGCETARSGLAGLCQDLVGSGHVPLALGWGMPVIDSLATLFANSLFRHLAAGDGADAAIDHARADLLAACPAADPSGNEILLTDFALPRLYAAASADLLYDPKARPEPPPRPSYQPAILDDNIRGLKEGFVGRRRILQRTLPVLRDADDGKTILLLTGIGGAGKSTLATRLANRLGHGGLKVVALRHREKETPELFAIRLLQEIQVASLASGNPHPLTPVLTGDAYELPVRMRLAIEVLNALPLLLVLDNLETLMPLPPAPPAWQHSAFGIFFTELTQRLTGESRALLTCRYVPAGFELPTAAVTSPVLHLGMPDFTEADFFKCAEYHEGVAARLASREISRDLLAEFHRKLGATPRFVKQALPVLAELPAEEITASLESIGTAALSEDNGDTADRLRALQQQYFADLFLPGLYAALSPAHRAALSRFAISDLALPPDGVAATAGIPDTEVKAALRAWLRIGLIQCFDDRDGPDLFSIYPLQRGFLTAPERLPAAEEKLTHKALAAWLKECSEKNRMPELGMTFMAVYAACLSHARAATGYDLAAWAATRIGFQLHRVSEFRAMRDLAADLLTESRHPDFLKLAADALEKLGDWPKAHALLLEAAPGFQANGDRAAEAAIWNNLATIEVLTGDYPAARENFWKSLEIKQSLGDRAAEATTWHNLANIDLNEGNYPAARENFQKALEMRQAIGDRAREAPTWQGLASIDVYEGHYPAAREKFQKALEVRQAIGDRAGEGATWHQLASIDLQEGNYPAALENFQRSLEIQQAIGNRASEAATWAQLSMLLYTQTGSSRASLHLAAVAWLILKSIGSADQKTAFNNLAARASDLSLTEEALGEEIQAALASYQTDGGNALLAAAFPNAEDA
jgi:tetratricopeptide (TPR) repeat protein